MFALGILIGIYCYIIFSLGVLGLLYKSDVAVVSFIFIIFSYIYFRKNPKDLPKLSFNKKIKPFILLFGSMSFVNLFGALTPELSFDALWYHLTIPKIFIQNHSIFYIHGGLFYYSLMPKLGEMLFIPSLMFGNETIAKLTQWIFGILTAFVIYKVSRKYFDERISIIASLIFYSSLVVAWESTVAYIDLIRTFFEIMALWGVANFFEKKEKKWLIEGAVMLGLAISTKFNALGSIPIFVVIFFLFDKNKKEALKSTLLFSLVSVLIVSPWFFFSFLNTKNPFFPFFSNHLTELQNGLISISLLKPPQIIRTIINLFVNSSDPITPIYIAFLPLLLINIKNMNKQLRLFFVYAFLGLLSWYPFAYVGGSRFMLAYLPAFSILSAGVIQQAKPAWLKKYLIGLVAIVCLITIFYRGAANSRYIPVVLGFQTKQDFLTKNLNFKFGDFYDTDGYFKNKIKPSDKVLLYGFHNLYYVDFPFVHNSYAKKGEGFNYIATQDSQLPTKYSNWSIIYSNTLTNVKLYSLGGIEWHY